jgi:thiol:disulfide interchange protein DsbD
MFRKIIFFILPLVLFPAFVFASPVESMNGWIEQHLSANNSGFGSFLFLFLGGVLASLLPCVYPLYPITIKILNTKAVNKNRFLQPVIYFVGIAAMYFLFGLIASITGGAFNTVLHFPITNLLIAIVIFILGLSSMDLLYLPIFSGSTVNSRKTSLISTFLMGMTAGLLSSACVGPVVVSILIGIASSSSQFSLLVTLHAALKMLLFGIGVGLPFLLIGVFGLSLPKSGKWMKYIQLVIGAFIIYFSYVYLEKALLGYGFVSDAIVLIGFSILIILYAVFHLQSIELLVYEKTKRALLFIIGLIGILLLVKGFLFSSDISIQKEASISNKISSVEPKTEQKGQLTWYLDEDMAYAAAKEKSKPVFIDFHADWCTNCKEFQKTTQSNTALNEALKNAILLKVYEGSSAFKKYVSDPRFPELKVGLPFFLITDKDENLLYKTNDYMKSDEMIMFLSN